MGESLTQRQTFLERIFREGETVLIMCGKARQKMYLTAIPLHPSRAKKGAQKQVDEQPRAPLLAWPRMLSMLQSRHHLLQVRLEYRLVLSIIGAAMTIRADRDDCIWRIRSPIRKPIDVMHFQKGLVLRPQKRGGSTTAFTAPASTPLGIELDPLASLTKGNFTLNRCGGWPGITQCPLA